ncbi:hypothetical protein N4G65_29465, partial [Streptomyces fulvoviolaceus]|nr:hypothetical protein [Streptomyces fulvoviolaceus]
PERGPRELEETWALEEAEALREEVPEPTLQATAPTRTIAGSDLLAEPTAAGDRTTAASSGTREDPGV